VPPVRVCLLILGACASVLVGPAGQAETWQARDARHDVSILSYTSDPEPCGTVTDGSDPTDELRDITRLRVDHTTDGITLDVGMRDVRRRGSDTTWTIHLRVPAGAFFIGVAPRPRGHKLLALLAKEPHFGPPNECGYSGGTSSVRSCEGLEASLDARHKTLRVALPRECLKDPRWVQAGVDANGGFTGGAEQFTSDSDEWTPSGEEDTGYPPPYGPRVHVG
jgi:hypothetical protein